MNLSWDSGGILLGDHVQDKVRVLEEVSADGPESITTIKGEQIPCLPGAHQGRRAGSYGALNRLELVSAIAVARAEDVHVAPTRPNHRAALPSPSADA